MQEISLYVFNPESDLATANGDAHYMPPLSAQMMATDLALLPLWYAESDSMVLCENFPALHWLEKEREQLGVTSTWLDAAAVCNMSVSRLLPWGWNARMADRFRKMGIADDLLPGIDRLGEIRRLSHRSFSVKLWHDISNRLNDDLSFCGAPQLLGSATEIEDFVTGHSRAVLKAPWSGSGKGLYWSRGEYTQAIRGWSNRILSLQQCMVGEPVFEKCADFAMEFFSDGLSSVTFAGFSFFQTDAKGAYKGNWLASDDMIETRLTGYVAKECLERVRICLEEELSKYVAPHYRGYLGVDMMICPDAETGRYRMHPCVEVNLRMNMGMAARRFYDLYVKPGKQGTFYVDYFEDSAVLLDDHRERCRTSPLKIADARIVSGYMSLTPVSLGSHYRTSIEITSSM